MSKRTCDTGGVVMVITREKKQAISLAVRRKCGKHRVADSFEVLHSKPWGVPVETRWCVGAVH